MKLVINGFDNSNSNTCRSPANGDGDAGLKPPLYLQDSSALSSNSSNSGGCARVG